MSTLKDYVSVETSEKVAKWIDSTNYSGDLSALCAGLYDLYEGVLLIYKELIPTLLELKKRPKNYDKAHDLLMDLFFEFDHLEKHCRDAKECLDPIVKHIAAIAGEFNT